VRVQAAEAARRIPELGAAVTTARSLVRERSVQEVLTPSADATAALNEARRLLAGAIEAETEAIHSAETLRLAEVRASTELSAATDAAARDEERRALAVLRASAAEDRREMLRLIDRAFLLNRIEGRHGSALGMIGGMFGTAISGEAMIARTSALFRQLTREDR
jgi:hypothetical protein